ncbi:hypothetical protein BV25DRAFT_1658710 [Artomyces pyxidatus]|uniref:Uncharacterized protein n=1 Tax=Artomyces pyxidatus TaxID=48021 RepID=A0ACB8SJK5_9AGAM|nr:hypothetical protein BV25DRAFT_1658710 [Artomyces pyxidatus]
MLTLPHPILLLIHIHLLSYPHANNPEYDEHIFDSKTRGLRDRTKTMEDLCYFLVGKIHGKAKSVSGYCKGPKVTLQSTSLVVADLSVSTAVRLDRVPNGLNEVPGRPAKSSCETCSVICEARQTCGEECGGLVVERRRCAKVAVGGVLWRTL